MTKPAIARLSALLAAALLAPACGMAGAPLRAELSPLALPVAARPAPPAPLDDDLFKGDSSGKLTEEDLKRILEAPVFIEAKARVGVVPVASRYAVDADLPLQGVPGQLTEALEGTGHFEVASEVSTDWPASLGVAGLRELAARYRAEYLLLYRHRFVDRTWTNAWALTWFTFVGGFVAPQHTLEVAGVVEATLFDVKSGTLLFTVYERVHAVSEENLYQHGRKRRAIKERLLGQAADKLAARMVDKVGRLVAARPPEPARAPATALPARAAATGSL
jgi:hypothetical protein